jgi:hypothetical protein
MNKKKLLTGLVLILTGVWFYTALSTFKVEGDAFLGKLIIKEGTVRTADEVAEVLAKELDFDLEGAYKTGYAPIDVTEYLIQQPHNFPVTIYNGKLYEGRRTVPYFIPLSVCIIMVVSGVVMVLLSFKSKKAD